MHVYAYTKKTGPIKLEMSLDNFKLVEPLGSGFCSHVFRASRKTDDRRFVLKYYNIDSTNQDLLTQIHDHTSNEVSSIPIEAFFLQKTKHIKGCVSMLEYFEDKTYGKYVIVMEDLTNHGFTNLSHELSINDGFLNESTISWILNETIHTLLQLHDVNILHCDIKPDNVFINRNTRQIKLIDFNLAMELASDKLPIPSPSTIGFTPEYAPPEVLLYKRLWTPASEIWSLGSMAFVLLYRKFPFPNPYSCDRTMPAYPDERICSREIEISSRKINSRTSEESSNRPKNVIHLSGRAKEFLMLCLHKKPECRPSFQKLSMHPFLVETKPLFRHGSSPGMLSSLRTNPNVKAS